MKVRVAKRVDMTQEKRFLRALDANGNSCHPVGLSPRETEILNWIKEGKSSWDISVVLGIAGRTVNFHIYNLLSKLGAQNRPHAVAIAVSKGWISLD